MMVRQASTVADLWMSNTKSGFFIRFTQNRRGRLEEGQGESERGRGRGGNGEREMGGEGASETRV